ncbi:MAG: hypothetical protein F6K40_18275 [Okeania sp. SIO3I5]|uniref:hypothetical protein n=1 Tax=Okeania sp. SIO3I5 TaxID=2607805 RepID=UPI0013B93C25|nr:hypothetical protein [Okeania sp. SIO3I5]NEQ38103.1 hypothetical protein [Okeania sp. SIO3I5]
MIFWGASENENVGALLFRKYRMFAQWRGLLPENLFTNCIQKCLKGESTYDILSGRLFQEMNNPGITKVGMFQ